MTGRYILVFIISLILSAASSAGKLVELGPGYSKTSVNTAVFRTNSLATLDSTQYISYYDPDGYVMVGKRCLGSEKWELARTGFKGNVKDAHNVISIGVDGDGYLHIAFDHHGHPLRYARSVAPGSLVFGEPEGMVYDDEQNVTYPEFYRLSNGDMLFIYRSGASGRGNMVINRYDVKSKKWSRVQNSLLDGEEERSPYWQVCVDSNDVIHVSWVWRETWLVETNHDMCYARSEDGGKTWKKSDGTLYSLPITASNAEYACLIPQNSELINQTSMAADGSSRPYIASYWREEGDSIPQYHLIWNDGTQWHKRVISSRTTPFSLSGGGTKMIPVSRPQIVVDGDFIGVLFRDAERGSKVSLMSTAEGPTGNWTVKDLTAFGVDAWEPTFDVDLWDSRKMLNVFVQHTSQGDGERVVETADTPVYVLDLSTSLRSESD